MFTQRMHSRSEGYMRLLGVLRKFETLWCCVSLLPDPCFYLLLIACLLLLVFFSLFFVVCFRCVFVVAGACFCLLVVARVCLWLLAFACVCLMLFVVCLCLLAGLCFSLLLFVCGRVRKAASKGPIKLVFTVGRFRQAPIPRTRTTGASLDLKTARQSRGRNAAVNDGPSTQPGTHVPEQFISLGKLLLQKVRQIIE